MKIIRDNKVYVQAKDIAVLADSNVDVPQKVVVAIFKDYEHNTGSREKTLERYLCFEGAEALYFFQHQDWIINYDEVKGLSTEGCLNLLTKTMDKKRLCLSALQDIRSERSEEILLDRCKFIDHEEEQLKSVIMSNVQQKELPLPRDLMPTPSLGEKISGFIKKIGEKK